MIVIRERNKRNRSRMTKRNKAIVKRIRNVIFNK